MPRKLKTACRAPRCRNLTHNGYCGEHQHLVHWRAADSHRGTSKQRGYDQAWKRLRRSHLQQEPLCQDCLKEGFVNGTNLEVDHIIPIGVRPDLRLEPSNLQTLCRSHHKRKTDRERHAM